MGSPSASPPASPPEILPEVVMLDGPTPTESPGPLPTWEKTNKQDVAKLIYGSEGASGPRTRIFFCTKHPTKLGTQYACTVVMARNEKDAAAQLGEWLERRGLGSFENYAQYGFLEFNVAEQSVVIACSDDEHARILPTDEWAARYASQRRVFLLPDAYVGCKGTTANIDVAAGAIVGAMDVHDACAILSGMFHQEHLLATNHMANVEDFIALPREGPPGGCVFPLSLYTTAE